MCRFAARHHQVDGRHNRRDESGKKNEEKNKNSHRLCARIPNSHPNKTSEPLVALKPCHLHRPTRVTGCDRTPQHGPFPSFPGPPTHPRAWHLSHSVALDRAAGREKARGQAPGAYCQAGAQTRPLEAKVGKFLCWNLF